MNWKDFLWWGWLYFIKSSPEIFISLIMGGLLVSILSQRYLNMPRNKEKYTPKYRKDRNSQPMNPMKTSNQTHSTNQGKYYGNGNLQKVLLRTLLLRHLRHFIGGSKDVSNQKRT